MIVHVQSLEPRTHFSKNHKPIAEISRWQENLIKLVESCGLVTCDPLKAERSNA